MGAALETLWELLRVLHWLRGWWMWLRLLLRSWLLWWRRQCHCVQ